MKIPRFILLTLSILLLALPLVAQSRPPKVEKSRRIEQTYFNLDSEETFKRPVKIPEAALRSLRQEIEKKHRRCLERLDQESDIASWFSASAVDLNNDHLSDLVVKSKKDCLNGADNDWFWILRNTGRGYQLVLFGGALGVTLLKTRTQGFRNIETDFATASTFHSNIYKFDRQVYKARICTEVENGSVTAKPKRIPCPK